MNEKEKQIEEIAFSRCDVPERTKRFALQYVSEAYAGIKNCRECEFYNTCDRIDSVRAELRKKKKEGMKNMTEQETREKIFNIIREFNVKKRRYSTHTEPSDDDELADALIAAGIGDVETVQKIAASATAMAVLEAAKAEHRAEVTERALCNALNDDSCYFCNKKSPCECEHRDWGSKECITVLLRQAEKELAEEGKDD